jgi:hypothetical protein
MRWALDLVNSVRSRLNLVLILAIFPIIVLQTGYLLARYNNLKGQAFERNLESAHMESLHSTNFSMIFYIKN